MKYVPYPQLGERPNVIVDGAANAHTVLSLSHWPHSPTPPGLAADLSAEIVLRYLDRPELHVAAEVVSNNHFDEDGLVGVWAMVNPDEAGRRRDLLVDIAAAGDFATYRDRRAARVAFTLSAFADPEHSPLGAGAFAVEYPELVATLFDELLPRLGEICARVDDYRALWEAEDTALTESEAAIANGSATIEEIPALDLAVVTVPDDLDLRRVHRFTQRRTEAIHPMAVHNATGCFRVLVVQGRRFRFHYRYESWVQYISRRPLPRVDLAPLVARLSELERNGRWRADGVDAITPVLHLVDAEGTNAPETSTPETSIDIATFRAELEHHLATAQPAWDPY
jgi:hypothetical protein